MAEKDEERFLAVIAAHKRLIYKVANSYCKDDEDRKDLIQEIILQLWRSFSRYDPQYQLSTWIYRIALNVAISFYRKERRKQDLHQPIPETLIYLKDDTPLDQTNVRLNYLQRFIRELKEIDRAIILLYLEGSNQQEIGQILGISTTNVSTKVSRIKQQLQQKFSKIKTL